MTSSFATSPLGLRALEARVHQDLAWLDLPAKNWIPERTVEGERVLDIAIIGGGMAGMAASAALAQVGISAIILTVRPKGSRARGQRRRAWKRCAHPNN